MTKSTQGMKQGKNIKSTTLFRDVCNYFSELKRKVYDIYAVMFNIETQWWQT